MNGNPLVGWSPDPADITLTGTGLRRPECVLAQPSGDLWVADLSGGVLHIAPDGSQEVIRPRDSAGPFAPAENPDIDGNQGFSMPNGLCFDAEGNFVIANFGTDAVEHLSRDGHWSPVTDTVLWPDGSTRPDRQGQLPGIGRRGAPVVLGHRLGRGMAPPGATARGGRLHCRDRRLRPRHPSGRPGGRD